MAVPRNRHSNARKNSKRAHHAKTPLCFIECSQCGEKKRPHTACKGCGQYASRQVFETKSA